MSDKIELILLKLRHQLITKRDCLLGVNPPSSEANKKIIYRIGKLNEEINDVNDALLMHKMENESE